MTDARRPDPDAILAALPASGRGRLKILLGAAPGVGKTYAMLQQGHEQLAQGEDVIVAVVETHGRADTEALVAGLEVVPRRLVEYHGATLREMDLDALLARRPRIALVDELAHTNAPGSRHPKRYMDVEELLDAGIDVWTTINVQHWESLNDAVAQITGVQVRETVPDSLLQRADEVEIIDLPTEDLIRRLDEGKVYVAETAQVAVHRFFRPGNLNALRELALRRAADRVGTQVRTYMQAHAIAGPWPTTETIVVCVSPSPLSPRLVRTACRMAQRRNCEWLAVYVKGSRHYDLPDADRDRVAATLRLAEQLGGEAVTIPGDNTAADVAEYARSRNATEIVVGKSLRPRWQEALFGSIVHDLIRHSGSIDLYIVTGAGEASEVPRGPQYAGGLGQSGHPYLASAAAVAVAGGLCALLKHHLALPNLSMLFLMAVLYSATVWGLWPAVFAAVSSLLVYDFFFVEPVLTFTVANPQDVLALVMYLAVAVLTSRLTARIRDQAEASRRREAQTAALFALTKRVAAAGNLHDVCTAVAREVAQSLQARVAVLLPQEGQLVVQAIEPAEVAMTEAERAAAAWALEHGRPAGQGSDTLPGIGWYCLPLCSADARLGVLATQLATAGRPLSPSQRRLLEACADLAAAAIDRAGK